MAGETAHDAKPRRNALSHLDLWVGVCMPSFGEKTFVIPAGIQQRCNVPGTRNWVPAYAGTTGEGHLLYHRGAGAKSFLYPAVRGCNPGRFADTAGPRILIHRLLAFQARLFLQTPVFVDPL